MMSSSMVAETKFVSSFKDARAGKAEAAVLGNPNWQQCRESKAYGAFNPAQSSELRMACKSHYMGFRPSSAAGVQWLRSIFSPNKTKRALALVARPRAAFVAVYRESGHHTKWGIVPSHHVSPAPRSVQESDISHSTRSETNFKPS